MLEISQYFQILLFTLLAGLAIGCAVSMVAQPNPLYSAISLIGVFIALSGLYVMLAAPFIAAVQIIVYAGAIMVLVVFVIMLLNVEEEERRPVRLRFLIPAAVGLAAALFAEATFIIYFVQQAYDPRDATVLNNVGLTQSIGTGLFQQYLLPFEVTSVLLLMAIVGAITLARRTALPPNALVIPGSQNIGAESIEGQRLAGTAPTASGLSISETATETTQSLGLSQAASPAEKG